MTRRARRWTIGIAAVLLAGLAGYALLRWRNPFPGTVGIPTSTPTAGWWEHPAPLSDDAVACARYLDAVTWELPRTNWDSCWNVGGRQFGVFSIRYQAAFAGYAAAALGLHTPAYPDAAGRVLRNAIDHLLDRRAWSYIEAYWGGKPWFPDPVAHENIMYSGHLLQLVVLYEALTGDPRYRTGGFDLEWDATRRFHYTTLTLAEAIARQVRENACGGVACEPGLAFFPCNNHPHLAFRMMEAMGLGDWSAEREKWERFALGSYNAVFGGGAFKLAYHMPSATFIPRGHPGLDGWSLLWYQPWAADTNVVRAIWDVAMERMDPDLLAPTHTNRLGATTTPGCCGALEIPTATIVSFLYPAAVVCGDVAHAATFRTWLASRLARTQDARLHVDVDREYRIGTTANFALGLALEDGADLRGLVHSPLPREYFAGPLLLGVEPADTRVYRAYRDGTTLVVELDAPAGVTLAVTNLPPPVRMTDVSAGTVTMATGSRVAVGGRGRRTCRLESGGS